jgi:hypothetical protein
MNLTRLHLDVLDVANRGHLPRRDVAIACTMPLSRLVEPGYTFANAVRELTEAGFIERPDRWARWRGRKTPAGLTTLGVNALSGGVS